MTSNTALSGQAQGPLQTVTGTVRNATSGEPIRRALVQMLGRQQASVLTGPDGRFRFDDVAQGRVLFLPQKPGFFDSRTIRTSESSLPDDIQFTVGSGANDLQLKLYPSAHIVGNITDEESEAVENVSVEVLAEQIFEGRKRFQNRSMTTTDEDGTFRIDTLAPGRYLLFAGGHLLPAARWNSPPVVTTPTYYPDANDITSAQAVDLQPGQEFRADFRVRRERGYRVVAQVGGTTTNTGVAFSLENATGQGVQFGAMHFDSKHGQFVAEAIPSGTWILNFYGPDHQGHPSEARQEFTVDHADVAGMQFVLQPDISIPVTLNHSANQGQNDPTTNPGGHGHSFNINLQATLVPVDPLSENSYPAIFQQDTSSLRFAGVRPGKYKLHVQSFGNECVESATYGGVDLTRDYLVAGSDETKQPVVINMGADCASLNVRLQPGDHPVTSAFILISPSSSFAAPIVRSIHPETQGLGGAPADLLSITLAAGSYQVFAFSTLNGLEYADAQALRSYHSQSVTLDAGQKTDLTLELNEQDKN